LGSTAPRSAKQQKRFDRAFNEVVAAASPPNKQTPITPTAVAPGVLFASAVAGLGIPTTPPVPGQKGADAKDGQPEEEVTPQTGNAANLAEAQLPQPSLFTTHKPWRCPNPGCNKAYKQSNGLKYHQQKG
jgi:transcription factor SFP1